MTTDICLLKVFASSTGMGHLVGSGPGWPRGRRFPRVRNERQSSDRLLARQASTDQKLRLRRAMRLVKNVLTARFPRSWHNSITVNHNNTPDTFEKMEAFHPARGVTIVLIPE